MLAVTEADQYQNIHIDPQGQRASQTARIGGLAHNLSGTWAEVRKSISVELRANRSPG